MKLKLDNRGEGFIDVMVATLVFFLLISIALTFLPIFIQKYNLNQFANEIVREAEITGNTSVSVRIEDMKTKTGLDPTISWAGTSYFNGTKVQLNKNIYVTISIQSYIGNGFIGRIPITITAKASGKSEVYYK